MFINACARAESRTAELARHLLAQLDGEVTEVDLYKEALLPLDSTGVEKREALYGI